MIEQANVQLADCLVRMGVITSEAGEYYKARVRREFKPLGRILLDQRRLTIHQLAELILMQAEEPCALLGELAVREGHCTPDEVGEALAYQRESCPHILEMAYMDEDVDTLELIRGAAAYIRHAENLLAIEDISCLGGV